MSKISVRIQRVTANGRTIDPQRLSRMTGTALAETRRKVRNGRAHSLSARAGPGGLEESISRAIAQKIASKLPEKG